MVGGIRLAVEEGRDQGRILAAREDPADPAPAPHPGLGVAGLVLTRPQRDQQQLAGAQVARFLVAPLERLHHRGDRRIRGEQAAVHQRSSSEATGRKVGGRGRGGKANIHHRHVAVGGLAGAPPLEEVRPGLAHVIRGHDQLPEGGS
jgi:hypothetical protein